MRRKVPTTVTIELEQLERLNQLSERTRINRSVIVRDAIERELQRYEAEDRAKVAIGEAAKRRSGVAAWQQERSPGDHDPDHSGRQS